MEMRNKVILTSTVLATVMGMPIVASANSKVEMKVVRTSSLNIRNIQNQSEIIEKIKEGTIVEVIKPMEKQEGWYYVKTPSGKKGVCSGAYLTKVTSTSNSQVYYTREKLNIRSGAGTQYSVITTVAKGTKVEKISQSNGWAKVRLSNKKIGYCNAAYLQENKIQANEVVAQSSAKTYYVDNTDSLNVRTGPSTSYSIYKKMRKGESVKVMERRSDGWSKISMDGKCYYVSSRYLNETKPSSASSAYSYVCSEAKIPTAKIAVNSLKNVINALSKVDGKVIAPGGEFDYLKTIGARTTSNGYVSSTIISGGSYTTAIGGGICAGSTAIHNAVVKSGLKVVERRNHSIPSGYVQKGMDAMVSGSLTYRFKNTSKYPVKIRAYVSGGYITVRLESTGDIKNGYTYQPEVTVSSDGLKATATVWKMKNGKKVEVHQVFNSTYKKA